MLREARLQLLNQCSAVCFAKADNAVPGVQLQTSSTKGTDRGLGICMRYEDCSLEVQCILKRHYLNMHF